MSDHDQPEAMDRIDAYLDGLLSEADRQAFDREVAADASLRAQVEHQRQIDASLQRLFAPPASVEGAARLGGIREAAGANGAIPMRLTGIEDATQKPAQKRKPMGMWPIAAAILLGLGISIWVGTSDSLIRWLNRPKASDYVDPGPVRGGPPSRELVEVYKEQEAAFKPAWECRDREQFARTFERRFGVPLVAEAPAEATVWGLAYKTAISRSSVLLLAALGSDKIVVFADRRGNGPEPATPAAETGLHLFKREIKHINLYELSRLPEPRILPLFRDLTPADARGTCPERR